MELYIMNKSLVTIGIIDTYDSIIWTKRCFSAGDFELYLPATTKNITLLQAGNYIYRLDDDTVMIIEKLQITTDYENGNYLTVSGRSLESILARRIVWKQTFYYGKFEDLIYKLINENAVNPTDTNRKISNLILDNKPGITSLITKQLTGANLYEAIVEACTAYEIGWKITLNSNKKFVFSLYKGVDRSYNQSENPYVVFSPEFDNLINSNYESDVSNYANVALVAGEGEGKDRKTVTVSRGAITTDLDRFEIFVDAKDVSSNTEEPMSTAEYYSSLSDRGSEKLSETVVTSAFEGELETTNTFTYKRDWYIGDIVQIENEYGMTATSRIIEIIESEDISGKKLIPTFGTWEV